MLIEINVVYIFFKNSLLLLLLKLLLTLQVTLQGKRRRLLWPHFGGMLMRLPSRSLARDRLQTRRWPCTGSLLRHTCVCVYIYVYVYIQRTYVLELQHSHILPHTRSQSARAKTSQTNCRELWQRLLPRHPSQDVTSLSLASHMHSGQFCLFLKAGRLLQIFAFLTQMLPTEWQAHR